MTDTLIHTEVDRLLETLDGELTSHSRVIDGHLDLRAASEDKHLVALIDHSLRNLPGRNAVDTNWWRKQLIFFRLMVAVAAIGHNCRLETPAHG